MNAGQHGRDVQIREEDEIVKDEREQNYTDAAHRQVQKAGKEQRRLYRDYPRLRRDELVVAHRRRKTDPGQRVRDFGIKKGKTKCPSISYL